MVTPVQQHVAAGGRALKEQRFDDARGAFEQALQAHATHRGVLAGLGAALRQLGEHQALRTVFADALGGREELLKVAGRVLQRPSMRRGEPFD